MLSVVVSVVVGSLIVYPICVKSSYNINVPFARSSEIRCIYMHQLVVIMRVYIWLTGLGNLDTHLLKKKFVYQ